MDTTLNRLIAALGDNPDMLYDLAIYMRQAALAGPWFEPLCSNHAQRHNTSVGG